MANEKDTSKRVAETVSVGGTSATGATGSQSREAVETLRETIGSGTDTARAATEAGRRTVERGASTAREVAGAATDAATRMTEETAQRFGQFFSASARVSEETAQRTQQTFDALVQTGSVVGEGMQTIMREWVNYAQGAMQRQAEGFNEILKVRSVQDLVGLQADRIRREMELLLDTSARVSEQAAKVSTEAYGRLHDQADRVRGDRRAA